jgi:hypothetical protein
MARRSGCCRTVVAALATLVNGLYHVEKHILQAVEPLEAVQVVHSVGKNIHPVELLKRAALCFKLQK